MTQTTARIKKAGKHFEIIVDLEKALKFKKGQGSVADFLEIEVIYSDSKKGFKASEKDLKEAFGTADVISIAERIVKAGEILSTQDYRDEEKEKKLKQVIDYLANNTIDPQTGNPHTAERIKSAMEQAQVIIKNSPIADQIPGIVEKINSILPIKLETKKIKIIIPAAYTGKAYGIVASFKDKEKWLNNGDLEIIASIPSGNQLFSFYEKLNSVTHGSAVTEEVKEE